MQLNQFTNIAINQPRVLCDQNNIQSLMPVCLKAADVFGNQRPVRAWTEAERTLGGNSQAAIAKIKPLLDVFELKAAQCVRIKTVNTRISGSDFICYRVFIGRLDGQQRLA